MRILFVDTAYWVALFDPRDQWHQIAMALARAIRGARLVTTEEVLAEVLTYFADYGPQKRREVAAEIRRLQADPAVEIVPQSAGSFESGLALYEARPDKEYSLADCTSMTVMRGRGITEVLTADHHFVQEGFVALMRP
jgi:predicted nucleic acid-binding protein